MRIHTITLLIVLSLFGCQRSSVPNPIPLEQPLPTGTSIYGKPQDGCLFDARKLDIDNLPYYKSAYATSHLAAHTSMWQLLQLLHLEYSIAFKQPNDKPILIGDIARENGGGILLPHQSHQTGLDVDLYFFDHDPKRTDWPRDYVKTNEGASDAFDLDRNWWMVGFLALNANVDRIFVAPEIKHQFCQLKDGLPFWQGKQTEILRRLRPWFGHRDHFHVRLNCPAGETLCFSTTDSLPQGDGCNEAASWLEDRKTDHTKSNLRLEYFTTGEFNTRCFQEEPNEVSEPRAMQLIKEFQEQSAQPPIN